MYQVISFSHKFISQRYFIHSVLFVYDKHKNIHFPLLTTLKSSIQFYLFFLSSVSERKMWVGYKMVLHLSAYIIYVMSLCYACVSHIWIEYRMCTIFVHLLNGFEHSVSALFYFLHFSYRVNRAKLFSLVLSIAISVLFEICLSSVCIFLRKITFFDRPCHIIFASAHKHFIGFVSFPFIVAAWNVKCVAIFTCTFIQ